MSTIVYADDDIDRFASKLFEMEQAITNLTQKVRPLTYNFRVTPDMFDLTCPTPAGRYTANGATDKSYIDWVGFDQGENADIRDYHVPENYDGGLVRVRYACSTDPGNKKHTMQLRTISVGEGDNDYPDLGVAFDISTEVTTNATSFGYTYVTAYLTAAQIGWVADENIKMRLVRKSSGDVTGVIIYWIEFSCNGK